MTCLHKLEDHQCISLGVNGERLRERLRETGRENKHKPWSKLCLVISAYIPNSYDSTIQENIVWYGAAGLNSDWPAQVHCQEYSDECNNTVNQDLWYDEAKTKNDKDTATSADIRLQLLPLTLLYQFLKTLSCSQTFLYKKQIL